MVVLLTMMACLDLMGLRFGLDKGMRRSVTASISSACGSWVLILYRVVEHPDLVRLLWVEETGMEKRVRVCGGRRV